MMNLAQCQGLTTNHNSFEVCVVIYSCLIVLNFPLYCCLSIFLCPEVSWTTKCKTILCTQYHFLSFIFVGSYVNQVGFMIPHCYLRNEICTLLLSVLCWMLDKFCRICSIGHPLNFVADPNIFMYNRNLDKAQKSGSLQ